MTKHRWQYTGDMNLEYGGLFWREDDAADYVLAVRVTPCSDAGGADNLFHIESGSIYLPDDERRKSALDIIGATVESATRRDLVESFAGYHGLDGRTEHVVRIGPNDVDKRSDGWNPEPDAILRGGSSLKRYVRREFLD